MPTDEEMNSLRSSKDREIEEVRREKKALEEQLTEAQKKAEEAETNANRYARDSAVAKALRDYGQYGLVEDDLKDVADPHQMEVIGKDKKIAHLESSAGESKDDDKAKADKDGKGEGPSDDNDKSKAAHRHDGDVGDDDKTSGRDLSGLNAIQKLSKAFE